MLYIGHRGCNYDNYNQNTIRSFEKVISQGCKAFEFDVQLTLDKKLVIVHNLDLEQVSNGKGKVVETTFKDLEKLDAGAKNVKGDKIPTLEDVLNLGTKYKDVVMHLELKGDNTGYLTGLLIKSYLDSNKLSLDNFLISSFNWNELKEIRKVIPLINIALLEGAIRRKELLVKIPNSKPLFSSLFAYGNEDYMLPKTTDIKKIEKDLDLLEENNEIKTIVLDEVKRCLNGEYYKKDLILEAKKLNAYSVNLWYKTLKKEDVEEIHKNSLKVFVYTINNQKEIDNVKQMGVDGVFTDFYQDYKE